MTDDDLDYDHLALGLKEALEKDKSAFDADRLQKYTGLSSRVIQCMASDSMELCTLRFLTYCRND